MESTTLSEARNAKRPSPRSSSAAKRRSAPASVSADDLSIGELAKMTDVSTRTIRYYEELGILPSPPRTPGGTRRYPREYAFYLEGAKILKQIGFGLDEIAELGRFALTGAYTSKNTQKVLQRKLAELEHRIRTLTRLHEIVAEAASAKGRAGKPAVPHLLEWVSKEAGDAG